MKHRWQAVVKDYFTFSKKERWSLLAFLIVGLVVYFLPSLLKPTPKVYTKDAFQKELAHLEIKIDSSRNTAFNKYNNYIDEDDKSSWHPDRKYYDNVKGELFTFDPNTLDAEGWKRLGVRDKTIQTIQNFLAKGYKFRQPEDIKKIYGLRPEDAARLIPFVRLEDVSAPSNKNEFSNASPSFTKSKENYTPRSIDINVADTTALIALPGIGSKLAARIITFREKLGGFSSVNQIGETYGLADSSFQKIKAQLLCSPGKVKTININNADVNELKVHPYIKWNIANAIVNYRKQHGNFASLNDLKKIDIISEDVFNKIAPYLAI